MYKEVIPLKRTQILRRMTLLTLASVLAALTAIPASAQLLATVQEEGPAVATFGKNGTVQEVFTFSAADFLVENNRPGAGLHRAHRPARCQRRHPDHGDVELAVGDVVGMSAVAGLRFTPLAPHRGTTSFSFTPVFSDGSAGADTTVNLYLLTAENGSPIAENLELTTYKKRGRHRPVCRRGPGGRHPHLPSGGQARPGLRHSARGRLRHIRLHPL
jgi:hypothetical protein